MATPEERAAALREFDQLTEQYKRAERRLEEIRLAIADAIVRHLGSRAVRPKDAAEHLPYDRNHIARIARAGGVEPLREATVVSKRAITAPTPTPEQPE